MNATETNPVLAFAARTVDAKERTVQVLIYDVIGDDGWGEGFTAKQLRAELKKAGDVDVINLRINSPGGITTDGFAIFNALKDHPARVEVDIDGDASSMASVIAQAGDIRRMASNAEMMIHEAKLPILGFMTAAKLRSLAEHIDIVNGNIAQVYASTTHQDEEKIRQWMADETYMSAATAKKRGFVDQVTKAGNKAAAMAWRDVPAHARPATTLTAAEQRSADSDPNEQQELPLVASATDTTMTAQGTAPTSRKGNDMESKQLALALGIGADSDEATILKAFNDQVRAANAVRDELTGLLTAIGADSVEAALGAIGAGKAALEQNETLAKRVEALEKTETEAKRSAIIARIDAADKCTPAQKKDLVPSLDITGLEAFERTAIRVMGKTGYTEPGTSGAGAGTAGDLTYNGKKFSELKPAERYQLGREDKELYNAMRAAAG
jgi:ATP-dependent Clp protease protease subunit